MTAADSSSLVRLCDNIPKQKGHASQSSSPEINVPARSLEHVDDAGKVVPVLELLPDRHRRGEREGDAPDDRHDGQHGLDAEGALVRAHDQLAAVERDGRDGERGDEDGGALEEGGHRARGRVVAELERGARE